MTNENYRFNIDRIEILDHPDGSFHILVWGNAADPAADEDVFEARINRKPVLCRVRRMENASIDPTPGSRPGYVLRIDPNPGMPSVRLETLDLVYNGHEPVHYEPEALLPLFNMRHMDYSLDLNDVRKNKLLLGGWFLTPDPEDLKFEVIDANGKKVEKARISLSNRFDVRRFFFVQGENLKGFNISIPNADKLALPVTIQVSNSKQTWKIPTVPVPEEEQEVLPAHAPLELSFGFVARRKSEEIRQKIRNRLAGPAPAPAAPFAPEKEEPANKSESADSSASAALIADEQKGASIDGGILSEDIETIEAAKTGPDAKALADQLEVSAQVESEIPQQESMTSVEEAEADFNDLYNEWFLKHRTREDVLEKQRQTKLEKRPLISLIVAAFNTPLDLLEKMIDSVKAQTYDNWQLCIADGSTNDTVAGYLESHPDPRISWCRLHDNLGISGNMNAAADLARGDVIALYDHDDFLEPDCLFEVASAWNEKNYDFIYTDEDKYEDETGRYVGPNFKPDFSPALLQSTNYVCHFLAIRKDIWDKVGGKLRSAYDGAQDFDLMLRLMDVCKPENIHHIPKILYHWRMHAGSTALDADNKTWAYDAGQRALEDWTKRNNSHGHIVDTEIQGHYHMRFDLPEKPLISVIIPNKDHADDLDFCVSSLEKMSQYRNFEIIIVENNSEKHSTFKKYRELQKRWKNVRVVKWTKPFNYSAINNFGVKHAKGEYLLFLNNDTEAIDSHLLDELLGQCVQPNVGAVGAKLYYEDGTFQHDGIIIGHSGVAGHALIGQCDENMNYRVRTVYNVSAVTAACMMVPRKVFDEVGGFNEDLPVAYNDVDFCLKVRDHGYWIVLDPFAMMYHYESRTRGFEDTAEKKKRFEDDVRKMYHFWPDVLRTPDPFYNPNLDITGITYQLRQDDEINPYINPVFLKDDYYTAGTIRPEKPTEAQMKKLLKKGA